MRGRSFRLSLSILILFASGMGLSLTPSQKNQLHAQTEMPSFELFLDESLEALDAYGSLREEWFASHQDQSSPFDPVRRDPGPQNPFTRPIFDNGSSLVPPPRQGSSFIIAMEVLYQTLQFYGVDHVLEKKGSVIDFRIIESKRGYFRDLDRIQVAFALQEFSNYLNAHMCNQPTVENFYRIFSQVPAEEIGLRFKYDMAWALLGNYLPRQPNAAFALGARWTALGSILGNSSTIRGQVEDEKELASWTNMLSDAVNVVQHLSRLMCYVDIRPKPKEEIKKRITINNLLQLSARMFESYDRFSPLIDEATAQGQTQQWERFQD
jgi:hypothetical protein